MKILSLLRVIKKNIHYFVKKIYTKNTFFTNSYGVSFVIDPKSSLDNYVKQYNTLDDWELLKKLEHILPKDSVIFDIGANVGHMSFMFAKVFAPKGKVFAYEPDPENIKSFESNSRHNTDLSVILVKKALQNNPELRTMNLHIRRAVDASGNQNRGISSLKAIKKFTKNSVLVNVATLDKEVELLGLSQVNFIKIDVEGAESDVLMGGLHTLKKYKPYIQYEYSNVLDNLTSESNTQKTFTLLKDLGYKQYFLDDKKLTELTFPNKNMKDTNVLCVPESDESFLKIYS